jgi:SAM-dependent methyltransferase
MRARLRGLAAAFRRAFHRRETGAKLEIDFWGKWLQTRGWDWPDQFNLQIDADAEIDAFYGSLIDQLPDEPVRILDVGAGPLTTLGKRYKNRRIELHAVDPLADAYNTLLDRYGIVPPVRTVAGDGESLSQRYPPDYFSLVFARNAVDHAADPLLTIRNMITVCRPGGFVSLAHEENEGERQAYRGFHQWNFRIRGGKLVIEGRGRTNIVDDLLAETATWSHELDGTYILSLATKR